MHATRSTWLVAEIIISINAFVNTWWRHARDVTVPPNGVTGLTVTYHAMIVAVWGWVAIGGQLRALHARRCVCACVCVSALW